MKSRTNEATTTNTDEEDGDLNWTTAPLLWNLQKIRKRWSLVNIKLHNFAKRAKKRKTQRKTNKTK